MLHVVNVVGVHGDNVLTDRFPPSHAQYVKDEDVTQITRNLSQHNVFLEQRTF